MKVKQLIEGQLERSKEIGNLLRSFCQTAVDKVMIISKEGYVSVQKAKAELEPKMRGALDEGVKSIQGTLDQLNQVLADRAIPSFRKAGVTQKRLEEKSNGVSAKVMVAEKQASAVTSRPKGTASAMAKSGKALAGQEKAPVRKAAVVAGPVAEVNEPSVSTSKRAQSKSGSNKPATTTKSSKGRTSKSAVSKRSGVKGN